MNKCHPNPDDTGVSRIQKHAPHLIRRRCNIPMMHKPKVFLALISICILSLGVGVSSQSLSDNLKLKQVHVVTRHGARTPLDKHANTLNEQSLSTLTRLGRQQMYDLGSWLRRRYIQLNEGITPLWLGSYHPDHAKFQSSGLDRTLVSANMLAQGLYPSVSSSTIGNAENPFSHSIPIFSKDPSNDITIRSYSNCPAFQERLTILYGSDSWDRLRNENRELLTNLASSFPDETHVNSGMVALENLWNIYDEIHVAKTECDEAQDAAHCQALPNPDIRNAVDATTWDRITRLAQLLEREKYSEPAFANMLGSNLMWEIFDSARYQGRDDDGVMFKHYSAHYPTLLGLMAALGVQTPGIANAIPDYASALIIEVFEEDRNDFFFRVVYKDGADNTASVLPLKFCYGSSTGGPADGTCPLRTTSVLQETTFATQEDWCTACRNTISDVCIRQALQSNSKTTSKSNSSQTPNAGTIVGTFIAGVVLGLLILGVSWSFCCRTTKQNDGGAEDVPPTTDKVDNAELS